MTVNILLIFFSFVSFSTSLFFTIAGISQIFNFKNKNNVFITAIVKDYEIVRYGIDTDFYPIYEFELDGEIRNYITQTFTTNHKKYKIGDKIKLCYNRKQNAFIHPDDVYFSFNLAAILLSIGLFILGIPLINFGIL